MGNAVLNRTATLSKITPDLRKMENKKHECFVCKKGCPCDCLEIDTDYGCIYFCSMECYNKSNEEYDWDSDFGEFEGHYFNCELGGKFKEKWKKALKEVELYKKLYFDFHAKWKSLKYPEEKKLEVKQNEIIFKENG